MTKSDNKPILFHLITEGSTDRKILSAIISKILAGRSHDFIEMSSTQKGKRGRQAIINRPDYFFKFLHHGFNGKADVFVICVDNDNDKEADGIGNDVKSKIMELYKVFIKNNPWYSEESGYINPCLVCAVPVKTMDYWMMALTMKFEECHRINTDLNKISLTIIKEKAYGEKYVYKRKFVDDAAINKKTDDIKKTESINKLRCLPSFQDFEEQLLYCTE
ncbi:hypothetical protein [Methanoplanus limicola]|uniref:DUF4276 family protein n=1 Tax=Methanoplanus limicola DSM 2279 TaxID=937775 RepID=H1Z065_9EURY|nr:hypothetical protein [Methanoplanus limicola]EHQ36157.1 hypothetical protein Metlim_2072 [Methanoplanus limicola DSM 2279]